MNIQEIKTRDERSKKFIFIPFCLICQAFRAQGIVRYGYSAVIKPIIEEILRHEINIIQMPCPESQLGSYEQSLKREPKGIEQYDRPEFREICHRLASKTVQMIKGILANGYEIIAILGVEYSPSCATKIQHSSRGALHRPGLYIEALKIQLAKEKIEIPFLGINQREIKNSLSELRKLLSQQKESNLISTC